MGVAVVMACCVAKNATLVSWMLVAVRYCAAKVAALMVAVIFGVGVGVFEEVSVMVGVDVAVAVSVGVKVAVFDGVSDAVGVNVVVGVNVAVSVGVFDGVNEAVGARVEVGVLDGCIKNVNSGSLPVAAVITPKRASRLKTATAPTPTRVRRLGGLVTVLIAVLGVS